MINMPVEITLPLDKKWTVYEVSTDSEKLIWKSSTPAWGMTWYREKAIYIDKSLPKDRKIETIRHEITHAVIFETQFTHNKKYNEEDMCDLVGIYGKTISELTDKVSKKFAKEK